MDYLANLDSQLFLLINHLPHIWATDRFALTVSGFGNSWIIWALIGVFFFVGEERRNHWFPLMFGITIGSVYFLSEVVLKNIFSRIRPAMFLNAVVVGTSPLDFSFPSTHAAIAFAAAVLLSGKEPKFRVWLYTLATLVSLSRIYLGYHYPIDVVGGCILGVSVGLCVKLLLGKKKLR